MYDQYATDGLRAVGNWHAQLTDFRDSGLLLRPDSSGWGIDLTDSIDGGSLYHGRPDSGLSGIGAGHLNSHVRIVLPPSAVNGKRHEPANFCYLHYVDRQRAYLWCLGIAGGGPTRGILPGRL